MQKIKKIFKMVFFSSLIGFILGFITYKNYSKQVDMVFSSDNTSYAFQIGVYNTSESANQKASENNGIVIQDNDFYRVYIAIATSNLLKEELSSYYDNQDISYYIKDITIDNNLKNKLIPYESLLSSVSAKDYSLIINKMLNEYKKGVSYD